MVESKDYQTKWSKSDGESQILYDITHKWNLILKWSNELIYKTEIDLQISKTNLIVTKAETWQTRINQELLRRKWHPTPVFLPGKSHGQRILVGYTPRGSKELDTIKRIHFALINLHILLYKIGNQQGPTI